jgi:hypothetical protein
MTEHINISAFKSNHKGRWVLTRLVYLVSLHSPLAQLLVLLKLVTSCLHEMLSRYISIHVNFSILYCFLQSSIKTHSPWNITLLRKHITQANAWLTHMSAGTDFWMLLGWDFFRSFIRVQHLLMNETDSGTLGNTDLITRLSLVPSCCEILKMSWHCVLFTVGAADRLDQSVMCESGSLQRQGNQWFAF